MSGRAALAALVLLFALLSFLRNALWRDSAALWQDAADKAPEKARVNYHLGYAYARQGAEVPAFHYLKKAKALDPSLFESRMLAAENYRRTGRLREAETEYRRRIEGDPAAAVLRNNLGIVLLEERKIAEAHDAFSEALRIDQGYAMAYSNRGAAAIELGNPLSAVADYRSAVTLDPMDPVYRVRLGYALLLSGAYADAVAAYDEALRLDPGNERARSERAEALRLQR